MHTTLNLGSFRLQGVSLGGIHTALAIPNYDIGFDVGMAIRSHVGIKHLFITHTHSDHIGALPAFLGMRDLLVDTPLNLYVGYDDVDRVRELVDITRRLGRYEPKVVVHAIRAGDAVRLNPQVTVVAFAAHHVLPCLGYEVVRTVRKLKPEHLGADVVALKKQLPENAIFDDIRTTELAFVTDTVADVFATEPGLMNAHVLVCESTFLCDDYPEKRARAYSHMHAREVREATRDFTGTLVLTHFSLAYSPADVRKHVSSVFADAPFTVHPFLPEGNSWTW